MDFAVGMAAAILCLGRAAAGRAPIASLIVLLIWLAWQHARARYAPGCGPAARNALPPEPLAVQPLLPLPGAYTKGTSLRQYGVRFNGEGWNAETGAVMPVACFFVDSPEEIELDLDLDVGHSLGIDPARLTAVGYGETKPIAPNDTRENMAKNRRIEFEVRAE